MNLKYIDYFESRNKLKIRRIYNQSFPKSERFPFWILIKCSESNDILFSEISDDDKTIGIEYAIKNNGSVYLMYFAIDETMRNKGYRSLILKDLIEKYNTIILSIEKVEENNIIAKKRKEFYLRSGFKETKKYIEQDGVYYELLCSNNYNITKN